VGATQAPVGATQAPVGATQAPVGATQATPKPSRLRKMDGGQIEVPVRALKKVAGEKHQAAAEGVVKATVKPLAVAPKLTPIHLTKLLNNLGKREKKEHIIFDDKTKKAREAIIQIEAVRDQLDRVPPKGAKRDVDGALQNIAICKQTLLDYKTYCQQKEKAELKQPTSFVSNMCASFDTVIGEFDKVTDALNEAKENTKTLLKTTIEHLADNQLGEISPQELQALRDINARTDMGKESTLVDQLIPKVKNELDKRAKAQLAAIKDPTEEDKAGIYLEYYGTMEKDNGTSDVKLITDADGNVAYAFKSTEGESEMMGTPKGFGTAREVLMSKLCDGIKAQTQGALDFRWPKTSMATIDNKQGALIAGVKGTKMKEMDDADIPATEVQKVLLCNLAMGQFDLKDEDVRFEDTPSGKVATPMDGGAAMPDADTLMKFIVGLGTERPGGNLVNPNRDKILMDKETVKQFLKIDVGALKKLAETEVAELKTKHNLDPTKLGLDAADQNSGIATAVTAIEGIKKILADDKGNPVTITMEDFLQKFEAEVIHGKLLPDEKKKAFVKEQRALFKSLVVKHPGLFPAEDEYSNFSELYRYVLAPEQLQLLKQFEEEVKPAKVFDVLKSQAMRLPTRSVTKKYLGDYRANVQEWAVAREKITVEKARIDALSEKEERARLTAFVQKVSQAVDQGKSEDYFPAMKKLRDEISDTEKRVRNEYYAAVKEL
jgi:hypothetical protein